MRVVKQARPKIIGELYRAELDEIINRELPQQDHHLGFSVRKGTLSQPEFIRILRTIRKGNYIQDALNLLLSRTERKSISYELSYRGKTANLVQFEVRYGGLDDTVPMFFGAIVKYDRTHNPTRQKSIPEIELEL